MLNLDGKDIPEFVKVNSIEFSVLPPIKNNLKTVRGKAGSYMFSQDLESRVFTVTFTIIAEEINGVMGASRKLAEWLYHDEPVKLIIDDEPDKYYLVVPNGETNITEMLNIGQGMVEFICIEPFAFGEEHTKLYDIVDDDKPITIDVGGNVETHPEIELTVNESITSISIVSSEDETIIIGEPETVSSVPVEEEPAVVQIEEMENKDMEEWTRAFQVDGGAIQGEYATNDYSFRVKDKNYGTGDTWHGASMIRDIDRQLEDFQIHFGFIFANGHDKKQVGRIEIYLLDENNVQFGKFALVDKYATASKNVFEARAGTWGEGSYFANGKHIDKWENGYGRILIRREGRMWTASISPKLNDRYDTKYEETWFDSTGKWENKLAKIQIHTGVYGKHQPVQDMAISHITIRERLTLVESEVPIIAIKDDVLLIDNSKMLIYLNGEPRFDLINPASNFLKLQSGENELMVSPAKADMKVKYTERWL